MFFENREPYIITLLALCQDVLADHSLGHSYVRNTFLGRRHLLVVADDDNAIKCGYRAYPSMWTVARRMINPSEVATVQWAIFSAPSPVDTEFFESICKDSIRGIF